MRHLLLSCLLILALVPGWSREPPLALFRPGPGEIAVQPILLDRNDSARTRVGAVRLLWGARLTSSDPAFGGFSALAVTGDRFTMLSDGGGVARFRLVDGKARDVRFADLPSGPGGNWQKRDRDSEALVIDPAIGEALVAFERSNAIWRYGRDFGRALGRTRPRAMRDWSPNSGAETMMRRADGSVVVIAEADFADDGSGTSGLVFAGDPTRGGAPWGFRLRPPRGWLPADAAELPDGRILIVLRRLRRLRFETALMLLPRGAIRPGGVARGRVVATFAAPLVHDSFEGIAVTREAHRTIVWLVSDDNQSIVQSTLMLKLAID